MNNFKTEYSVSKIILNLYFLQILGFQPRISLTMSQDSFGNKIPFAPCPMNQNWLDIIEKQENECNL